MVSAYHVFISISSLWLCLKYIINFPLSWPSFLLSAWEKNVTYRIAFTILCISAVFSTYICVLCLRSFSGRLFLGMLGSEQSQSSPQTMINGSWCTHVHSHHPKVTGYTVSRVSRMPKPPLPTELGAWQFAPSHLFLSPSLLFHPSTISCDLLPCKFLPLKCLISL